MVDELRCLIGAMEGIATVTHGMETDGVLPPEGFEVAVQKSELS